MEQKKNIKQLRKENNMRKLAAYVQLAELNKKEREDMVTTDSEVGINDCSNSSSDINTEPTCKKFKPNDESVIPSVTSNEVSTDFINGDRPNLPEEELEKLRCLLKQRAKALRKTPLLDLIEPAGHQAELSVPAEDRIPLFLQDVQNLIFYCVYNKLNAMPRWCRLKSSGSLTCVRVLLIEGAGISDFLLAKEKLPSLSESSFPFHLEVIMPSAYDGNLIEEFCSIPMPRLEYNRLIQTHGSFEKALGANCGVFKVLRAFFNVKQRSENTDKAGIGKGKKMKKKQLTSIDKDDLPADTESDSVVSELLPPSDKFPRTSLLLSAWQLIEESYPIIINGYLKKKYKNFVPTKEVYKEVNNFSPMYALDCEMCFTTAGKNELTRFSIINEREEVLLDTLVLPDNRIINYLTQYSGITRSMMTGVTTRLHHVQKFIQETLEPDAILLGQSLNNDLSALQMMHPYCIDTSVIFNLTGIRNRKSKLSLLSDRFLGEIIQAGTKGHSSVEDSVACLKLVQLKLSKSIEFGDTIFENDGRSKLDFVRPEKKQESEPDQEPNQDLVPEPPKKDTTDISSYATSLFTYATRSGKKASIIASSEVLETYVDYLDVKTIKCEQIVEAIPEDPNSGHVTCIPEESNNSIVKKIATKSTDSFLSVGHVVLSEQECDSLATSEDDTVEMLNSWVSQMHKSTPLNGLSIVVLCGRERSSNGVCFVHLNKQNHQRLNYKPKDSVS